MLILLPPSEGKTVPRRGKPLDLADLSFPQLTWTRQARLGGLVDLCAGEHDPALPVQNEVLVDLAAEVLGLGSTQVDLVHLNGRLRAAPTARADRVYTGVLYDALDAATLS
ncbi:MAG: peroxide stress protein YaaA, partial [Cellulomonas sp.]